MSNNGLMVSVWGPVGWKYLHSVAHGFPISPSEYDAKHNLVIGTTEMNYRNFFTSVGTTLPCALCRESYMKFIAQNSVRTSSRDDITRWLWEIHNMVNKKLGKSYKKADYKTLRAVYDSYRASCNKPGSQGCTEPAMSHTKKRCRITVEPLVPLYLDCNVLKITIVIIILAFIYLRHLP